MIVILKSGAKVKVTLAHGRMLQEYLMENEEIIKNTPNYISFNTKGSTTKIDYVFDISDISCVTKG